mmetsp:Transcript_95725/g.249371  ORF Transcript_95725/g.249371 Transcript_95725/m.249371 type:complete len:229 (-) Transcript_95725:483-1169(-)
MVRSQIHGWCNKAGYAVLSILRRHPTTPYARCFRRPARALQLFSNASGPSARTTRHLQVLFQLHPGITRGHLERFDRVPDSARAAPVGRPALVRRVSRDHLRFSFREGRHRQHIPRYFDRPWVVEGQPVRAGGASATARSRARYCSKRAGHRVSIPRRHGTNIHGMGGLWQWHCGLLVDWAGRVGWAELGLSCVWKGGASGQARDLFRGDVGQGDREQGSCEVHLEAD